MFSASLPHLLSIFVYPAWYPGRLTSMVWRSRKRKRSSNLLSILPQMNVDLGWPHSSLQSHCFQELSCPIPSSLFTMQKGFHLLTHLCPVTVTDSIPGTLLYRLLILLPFFFTELTSVTLSAGTSVSLMDIFFIYETWSQSPFGNQMLWLC